ncbi:hypothetical protein [Hydrogenophaga sp. 2FB]|uniref:hypothetical protein n=1 Tax=Hydrogenophaga sp. 2FB TaxID=2502187 RepID=UPI0010F4592E|nr:hypothetical protein [Hydrogenophaga sp. 2FB]
MDTFLGLRSWHWRAMDWVAAAVSGFAAGAVLMVLDLVWSAVFNPDGPWRTSHMIAPIFSGATDSLQTADYRFSVSVVSIALLTHYVLGIVFGLVLAAILAQLRLDTEPLKALVTGAFLGLLLYVVNFEVLTAFFPWLAGLRGTATLAAHLVFGCVAAILYWRLKRIATEP